MSTKRRNSSHTAKSQPKPKGLTQHLLQQATSNQLQTQISRLLQQGIAMHRQGQLSEALHCYQEILKLQADHTDALNLIGVLALARGDLATAIEFIQKSLRVNPDNVFAMNNLATAYRDAGRSDEAIPHLQKAIKLKPDYADAFCNLGSIYKDKLAFNEAELHFKSAIKLNPEMVEAWHNLAQLYRKMRQLEPALACAKQALVLQEGNADLHNSVANIYRDLGDHSAALSSYQRACEINPELANAQHFVQVLSGANTEKAPASYVSGVFDDYAENFDQHLTQVLNYQTPQLIAQSLRQVHQDSPGLWQILDLGCGTGLVGQYLAGIDCKLTGVDLSAKMLAKAKEKNVYHSLIQADISEALAQQPNQHFQIVVAADVFVYLGKLDEIFAEVTRVLIDSGLFCFSIEDFASNSDDLDYQLQMSGRYAHNLNYIQKLAIKHNLRIAVSSPKVIRTENNQNINGFLIYLQKIGS